jgi:hypothetical protein
VSVLFSIAKKIAIPGSFALALSFSFIPVFFIAGTYTIDYNFALLFILLAFRFFLDKKWFWTALMLGLATGFRISSSGFLVAFTLISLNQQRPKRELLKMSLFTLLFAILAYSPAIARYGLSFLDFHKPPFPGWANVAYKLSLGIWGLPLLLILGLFSSNYFSESALRLKRLRLSRENLNILALTALLLQLFVFVRLPFKSEFFIPALPFIWLWLFSRLKPKFHKALSYAAIISLLFFGVDYNNPWRGASPSKLAYLFKAGSAEVYIDPWQGPLHIDQSKRMVKSATVNQALAVLEELEPSWVICGWYWPELVLKAGNLNQKHHFDHYSRQAEIETALQAQYPIFYLPEIGYQNQIIHHHYLADSLGQALIVP